MEVNRIIHGDALDVLRGMPDGTVDCVVTSPPYYGLRDYGTAEWEGGDPACDHKIPQGEHDPKRGTHDAVSSHTIRFNRTHCHKCGAVRIDKQIGLEPTPAEYVARMVAVFAEVRRVLADDGTAWVNIGSSYAGSGKGGNPEGSEWSGFVGNNAREQSAKVRTTIVSNAHDPYVLRDDLTPDEVTYVLSELAAFRKSGEIALPHLSIGVDETIASLTSGE